MFKQVPAAAYSDFEDHLALMILNVNAHQPNNLEVLAQQD